VIPLGKCRISAGLKGAKGTKPGEQCVIIDVLRASSTIVTALAHGVGEIRAVGSIEEALSLRRKKYAVAGERQCLPIPGFDLGNSPVELLRALKKHPINKMVLTTSNLTRVLVTCKKAFICSSLNLAAVSRLIADENVNIVAVGGPHGIVEDLGVALALMVKVQGVRLGKRLIQQMITQSPAAQHLVSIGYGDDVKFVCTVDRYDVVPVYERGRVKAVNATSKRT
jgi:2-phosphosulfolactate phosphatase